MRLRIPCAIILSAGLLLLLSGSTSADLNAEKSQKNNYFQATTLSFSGRSTVSLASISWFFTTADLKPGGYDIRPLKVQQDGKLDFNLAITAVQTGGDDGLCRALQLKVMQDWNPVYQGNLLDFSLTRTIAGGKTGDLVFVISLPASQTGLEGRQCAFDFRMRSYRESPGEAETGLFASRNLQNMVSTLPR